MACPRSRRSGRESGKQPRTQACLSPAQGFAWRVLSAHSWSPPSLCPPCAAGGCRADCWLVSMATADEPASAGGRAAILRLRWSGAGFQGWQDCGGGERSWGGGGDGGLLPQEPFGGYWSAVSPRSLVPGRLAHATGSGHGLCSGHWSHAGYRTQSCSQEATVQGGGSPVVPGHRD